MRLILTGGFLGAGKTTAINEAVKWLHLKGHTVAVITNDQGNRLVDTDFLQQQAGDIAQVTNGCFCCNYADLSNAIAEITKRKPQYIFAEAVGSCTDMVATVVKPLQKQFDKLHISLTVLAEAVILFRQLQQEKFIFKKSVQYIWQKQLEEADIVLVSKADELPEQYHQALLQSLLKKYPDKKILFQNNKEESAIKKWLNELDSFETKPRFSLELDYAMYGEGEAALAWLDATVELQGVSAVVITKKLIDVFSDKIQQENWPIGHLKFLVDTGKEKIKISFTSQQEKGQQFQNIPNSTVITITVNARVECEPEELHEVFNKTIDSLEITKENISIKELNYFKPGFPKPVHHIMEVL